MRAFFVFFHRWLGLTLGLVIAFLGLSGSALVFRPELDARLHPHLLQVEPRAARASWQAMTDTVSREFKGHRLNHIFIAKTLTSSHEFWLDGGDLRVYVDPYSGRILGTRAATEGFFPWLAEAHIHLFSGEVGQQISGWSGLTLAALSVSGLILWFPRRGQWRRALRSGGSSHWKGRVYGWHRVGGFYLAATLLVASVSGMALVWHEQAEAAVAFVLGAAPDAPRVTATTGKLLPLDGLVAQAQRAFPEGRLARISFPSKPGAPLVIRKKLPDELHPVGLNSISLDGATGRVLRVEDSRDVTAGQRFINLRYPLHLGVWGGNFSRVLASINGLGAALLAISGVLMWTNRWKARKMRRVA